MYHDTLCPIEKKNEIFITGSFSYLGLVILFFVMQLTSFFPVTRTEKKSLKNVLTDIFESSD